jgi:peptidoglycan hydrolase-like protein with peptidoglycan-binding domain
MAHSLTWLPDVLQMAGLKVSLVPGWETRGHRGDVGRIFGVICHHTGVPSGGNIPTLRSLINGRRASPGLSAIPGPLAQLGLGRDGTFFVVAAGRANHAGPGSFTFTENAISRTIENGNTNFIGIEAENTGQTTDPWPPKQLDAYQRGVAAILKHIRRGSEFCIGHKEWAPGRKPDPSFKMGDFRTEVAKILSGEAPTPVLIPAVETGVPNGRPTLRRGMMGELTKQVQAKVGVTVDGNFGPKTEAAVRAFQRAHDLFPDGIVGPKTWSALDAA